MKIPYLGWWIAGLLFLVTLLNYLDRLALAVVSRQVRAEFHLTEQDYSHIIALFLLAYAAMYGLSGYVVDRLGTRRGLALFVASWSVFQMLHAAARGKWSLGLCRAGLGLAEPGNWPAAAKAIAEWFPQEKRALGVGIFNAGSSAGAALAPPLIAWVSLAFGWRAAFIITGLLGLAWLPLWWLLYQPPHRNRWLRAAEWERMQGAVRPPEETAPAAKNAIRWRRLLSHPGCYTILLARFLTDPVAYFIMFWLPEYLQKERGFDLAMVGKYAWLPFLCGDFGYLFGGWLSGCLMERGWSLPRARKTAMLLGAAIMPATIFAPLAPSAAWALAAICATGVGHTIWVSNLQTLPTDLFRGQQVATASGLTGMGGALGGVLATLGAGWAITRFSYAPLFLVAGLLHPTALLLVRWLLPDRLFGHPKYNSVRGAR